MSVWNPVTKNWEEESKYTKSFAQKIVNDKKIEETYKNHNNNIVVKKSGDIKSNLASAPVANMDFFKKSDAYKDGYQVGDLSLTAGSTIGDIGLSGIKGIAKFGENLVDVARYGVGQVADWAGADNYAKGVRERAKENTMDQLFSPVEKTVQKNSVLGGTGRSITEGIGNVIAMANGGALLPKAAATVNVGKFAMPTTSIVSGLGSGLNEAYENGATDAEAWGYGSISGLAEGFSESLFSGLGTKFSKVFGKGALDDTVIKGMTDKISNKAIKIITQSGLKAAGEGVEEVISGLGSAIGKKLTYMNNEEFSKIIKNEKLLDQFIMGSITSAIMQTPGTFSAVKNGQDYITGEDINSNINNSANNVPNLSETPNSNTTNQIPKNNQNLSLNSLNNNNINSNKYEYIETDNNKINSLRKSATEIGDFNNSNETNNLMNTIEKVIRDKNYNVIFDNTITNKEGKSVNAQITPMANGEVEIKLNSNSPRAGEFLLCHEITHGIETDNMKQLVLDYASKNSEFNQALKSLKQNYGVDDVTSEVVSDISGQLFGNQEFINSLSMKNTNESKSIIKTIYESIKHLLNSLTDAGRYRNFLQDLESKWREAYRTQSNNLDEKQYHVSQNALSDINSLLNGTYDTSQNIKLRDYTPKELVNAGIKDLPMLMNSSHVLDNILTEEEAKNRGIFKSGTTYHKLGVKNYLEIIDSMDNPVAIYQWIQKPGMKYGNNDFVVLTNKNIDGKDSIVPVYIETKGNYNYARLDTNKIKSVYNDLGLENKLEQNVKNGNMNKIYDNKKTNIATTVNIAATGNSFDMDNISQNNNNVNNDISSTSYSMQEIENDTQELDDSFLNLQKDNKSWQDHLEKNYKASGTRTNFKNLANTAPKQYVKNDFNDKITNNQENKKSAKELITEKLDNNAMTIAKLETSQKNSILNIDKKIKEKRDTYQLKKNKNTKIANLIQQQIISLENQKKNIDMAYQHRIEVLEERNKKMLTKEFEIKEQRKSKTVEYRDEAENIIISDISNWNDKSSGFKYKRETMERNINDIIENKEVSKKVVSTYIEPVYNATAKINKFINYYNSKISELKLNNKESQAVQMLGEGKFNGTNIVMDKNKAKLIVNDSNQYNDVKKGAQLYLDSIDFIENNNLDINKIEKAVETFRNIYDNLYKQINTVLKEQGYKEMDYRKNYFPHFTKDNPTSKLGRIMEKLNWKNIDNSLPTSIAGLTDTFRPGKTYFKNSEHRLGDTTEYNALEGFDSYIRGAADTIYLTEPIQKLRALENEIRYLNSEKGIQDKYEEIVNSDIDEDSKQSQISLLFENVKNPLNNFVTELRSYTDNIANKKSELDRRTEGFFNRKIYSTMTNIQHRLGSNMVGLNISSALTNFIPITQAWSQISTKNMLRAMNSTIQNQINNDGLENKSEFLVNRIQKSNRLYKTNLDKISDKANIVFEGIDSFTSNVIVRGKYFENLEKGMSQSEAMKNANKFARNVMAGRDKGSLPTIFNAKSPLLKLFTSFQVEVNNQYSYMFKDIPKDLKDEGMSKLVSAFIKMFFGAWLYNQMSEKITGRKSAFSPADITIDSINTLNNDNLSSFDKMSNISKELVGELPFIGGIVGGGRLPISSAIPNIVTTVQSFTDSFDEKKRKTAINNLAKELSKPIYYIAMPFGGGQLKKSLEGINMYSKEIPGSYTSSGKLRFTVKEDPFSIAKAALFGQYASKEANDYFDNGYTPLSEKQQNELKELDVSIYKYREHLSDLKKWNNIKADKDSDGNSIAGTALAKSVYDMINNDKKYSEEEINFYLSKLSSSDNPPSISDISKLDNDLDVYKHYFSLGTLKSKDEFINITNNYNIGQKEYVLYSNNIKDIINKYSKMSNIAATSNQIEKISTQKKNEIWQYINNLSLSKVQKVIIYNSLGGYSITQYKSTIHDYINKLQLSKSDKEKMWREIYK